MSTFQMGPKTHSVPMTVFKYNRKRLCDTMIGNRDARSLKCSFILLQGGKDVSFNDTDVNHHFRQESYFQYLFGVKEPDCLGVICIGTGETTLFVPRLPEEYATWMGKPLTLEDFVKIYEVDKAMYVDEIHQFFKKIQPVVILTLQGTNSDSGLTSVPAHFEGIDNFVTDSTTLHPILAECRVIKSPEEIEILRYVAKVSSDAHIKVMQFIRPGNSEYEGESVFLHHSYAVGGCRHASYTCICGSGENGAILHYGHAAAPNDRVIMDGDMCLFDMGANYCGYAADITCSFPANGKFSDDQKYIYNAVLAARNAVLSRLQEGVSWVNMHKLAARVLLEQLKNGGMLQGSIDEMLLAGLSYTFQPHGLGHLLGLDVHDVGGYLPGQPDRPNEVWLSKLRFARDLKAGMYVTVEPGCYFIEHLMDKALADPKLNKFINEEVFNRFRKFGGVRIEDDILITKSGYENFAVVPRSVDEIERTMAKRKKSI